MAKRPAHAKRPPGAANRAVPITTPALIIVALVAALAVAVHCYRQPARAEASSTAKSHTVVTPKPAVTKLHFAAQSGNLKEASLLLKAGAVVDAQTKLGATPLHVASEQGQLEVARLLLAHGAALDIRTEAGLAPLHFAAEQGQYDVARLLITSGAIIDAKTSTGHTPLHIAVQKGKLMVRKLA